MRISSLTQMIVFQLFPCAQRANRIRMPPIRGYADTVSPRTGEVDAVAFHLIANGLPITKCRDPLVTGSENSYSPLRRDSSRLFAIRQKRINPLNRAAWR